MSSRSELLANKRRMLQLRCAVQREEIKYRHADIELRLRSVDRVLNVAHGVIKHPMLIGAAAIGVALIGPLKIVRWLSRSVLLWGAVRRLGRYFWKRGDSAAESAQ